MLLSVKKILFQFFSFLHPGIIGCTLWVQKTKQNYSFPRSSAPSLDASSIQKRTSMEVVEKEYLMTSLWRILPSVSDYQLLGLYILVCPVSLYQWQHVLILETVLRMEALVSHFHQWTVRGMLGAQLPTWHVTRGLRLPMEVLVNARVTEHGTLQFYQPVKVCNMN